MLRSAVVDGNNDLDWLIAQYDSEIVFNDQSIQALVQHLAEIGRDRDTLIIVTADHGESMGEHQQLYFEHGTLTTETNAHVPLIFYHPKLPRGLRVKQTVSLVDVGPTILDLLGLGVPHTMQGESFAPLVLGRAFEHRRKDHFIIARYRYGYQSHAVTTDNYKLVLQADPRWLPLDSVVGFLGELWLPEQSFNVYHFRKLDPQLYDLRSDPDEQTNLAGRGLPVEQELRRELWRWIEEAYREGQGRKTMAADFDQETVDALRALGYGDIEAHPQAPREPAPASDRP
jgi:arylsulfatase A-like enzyme